MRSFTNHCAPTDLPTQVLNAMSQLAVLLSTILSSPKALPSLPKATPFIATQKFFLSREYTSIWFRAILICRIVILGCLNDG